MHIRMWDSITQVAQIAIGEHRVVRSPCKQDRNIEAADIVGDSIESLRTRMRWLQRNVFDEL